MKKPAMLMMSCLLCASATPANTQYEDAVHYAEGVKGEGLNIITGVDPHTLIPGLTTSPDQTHYYGGVTATSNPALNNAGAIDMNSSEAGKLVQEVIKSRPVDRISTDAPFISGALDTEDRAEMMTQDTDTQCKTVDVSSSQITNYTCERMPAAELNCIRTASAGGGHEEEVTEDRAIIVPPEQFTFTRNGKQIVFAFTSPVTGTVLSATLNIATQSYLFNSTFSVMNTTFSSGWGGDFILNATGMQLQNGALLQGTSCSGQGACTGTVDDVIYHQLQQGETRLTLTMIMRVAVKKWVPDVAWAETCPFDKSEQVKISSDCTEPGGYRTFTVNGQPYRLYSECWQYTDSYVSQTADNGTCDAYMKNSACTIASTTCLESLNATCLREQAVFSCEEKRNGAAQLCGDTLVCIDGSCDHLENHNMNDFQSAVSGLAALAAAGKDIAVLNSMNVAAFTGHAMRCRKAMAGFNNCCRDSGWGQEAGLANCSSEEKALGEAKARKLTIFVGSYCAHKVLGICTERKEAYCQFDSKLAKIIQEQGRRGQLGMGFGSGESPDCHGLTVQELQKLNFQAINFADFYDDLANGTMLPSDQAMIERITQQITGKMTEGLR